MKIGFIGMSHLGICHAVAAAEKGFMVKCFDESPYKIEQLSKGFIDFFEPNLDKIFKRNKKKIKFINDLIDLKECDLVFFSKDVPTNNKDKSLYDGIYKLIKKAIRHLNKKSNLGISVQKIWPVQEAMTDGPSDTHLSLTGALTRQSDMGYALFNLTTRNLKSSYKMTKYSTN